MFLDKHHLKKKKVELWWPIDGDQIAHQYFSDVLYQIRQTFLLYHYSQSLTPQWSTAHKIHSRWLVVQGLIFDWRDSEEMPNKLMKPLPWNYRYKALFIEKCGMFFILLLYLCLLSSLFPWLNSALKDQIITIIFFMLNWVQVFVYCINGAQ